MNSELSQTPATPGDHKSMEFEHGRGTSEHTIQPRYDDGDSHSPSTTQLVDLNFDFLSVAPAPVEANAFPVVEEAPSAASPNSASSRGSSSGSSSAKETHEPELSGWSVISEVPPSGPAYSIHDHMVHADVDWRNLNPSPLSDPPPLQNFVHEDGYDPNRIPASIFSSKPASPMDWSNASSESLFSIYMENSFSGYHGMFKSGEFGPIEQQNKSQNPFESFESKGSEGSNFSPNLQTLPEAPVEPEKQQGGNTKDDTVIHEGLEETSSSASEEGEEKNGDISIQEGDSKSPRSESKENHDDIDKHEGLSKRPIAIAEASKEKHEENPTGSSKSPRKEGFILFEPTNSTQDRLSNKSTKSGSLRGRLSESSEKSCGSFAFPILVSDLGNSSSFRTRSDKKEEPRPSPKQQHKKEEPKPPPKQQISQKSESPKTPKTPPRAVVKERGCLSWFSGWNKCW